MQLLCACIFSWLIGFSTSLSVQLGPVFGSLLVAPCFWCICSFLFLFIFTFSFPFILFPYFMVFLSFLFYINSTPKMPSRSKRSRISTPTPCRKTGSIPKVAPHPAQSYVVVDITFPSHIVSNRSLFIAYIPKHQVHCTAFRNNITIEGAGDVQIRVFAAGKSILLRMKIYRHVPS